MIRLEYAANVIFNVLKEKKERKKKEEEESSPLVVLIPVSLLVGEAGNGTSNQVSQVGVISYLA